MKDQIRTLTSSEEGISVANIALHELYAGTDVGRSIEVEDPDRIAALQQLSSQQLAKITGSAGDQSFYHVVRPGTGDLRENETAGHGFTARKSCRRQWPPI